MGGKTLAPFCSFNVLVFKYVIKSSLSAACSASIVYLSEFNFKSGPDGK